MRIPFWVKLGIWALERIPAFPVWLKLLLPALAKIVEALPQERRNLAALDLLDAKTVASAKRDAAPIKDWVKKHCDGVGCASDTKTIKDWE